MSTTCGQGKNTVNLLLFTGKDRTGDDRIAVNDRRLQHLLNVHRAKPGDRVRVGEVDGMMGHGEILELNQQRALLQISLDQAPPEKLPLTLVLALPRPKMLRRILRNVAEFGVKELHLINSYRVEKSYWQTPALAEETIHDYFLQGLEQARDTQVPTVLSHKRFKPFVEDLLPSLAKNKCALLAHPGDYPPCPHSLKEETLLVIGPEGGFIPYEVEKLQTSGCGVVSLGPRILRVENAVSSLLGKLI